MYLTPTNLVHYLLARGHVSADSVVDGDFTVVETGRRNRNFRVLRRHHPGWFIKQVQQSDPQAIFTLQREATCYQLASAHPRYDPLARLMPRLIDFDPRRHVLLLELLPHSETLTRYHQRQRAFPPAVGQLVGEGLGAYHSDLGRALGDEATPAVFPRQLPWVLSVHQAEGALFAAWGPSHDEVLRIIRQHPAFQQRLDALREGWRYDSLIHGDMKWDNLLLFEEAGQLAFRIVDWEMADMGDAAWDVGAILQAYLIFWIFSMPAQSHLPPAQLVAQAAFPIEAMHPSIRAFWRAYCRARGVAEADAAPLLARCMSYGAARMLQTAFEASHQATQLSPHLVMLLQVSLNILNDPQAAIADLLDL